MNKIMTLTGLSLTAAGLVLKYLDYASWVALLCSLTGIGLAAGAAVLAYRFTIKKILFSVGAHAAIQL